MNTWQRLKKDPSLWNQYFIREQTIKAIRKFFDDQGFHEVETPSLIAHPPAESYIDVFETTLLDRQRKGTKAYLSTSPEVALKKLMVAGIGNCYALTKSFRNMETNSAMHNPEFTILEWYRVGASYMNIMDDCENLISYLSSLPLAPCPLPHISPPWERLSITQAFKKYADINFDEFLDEDKSKKIALAKGYLITKQTTWEELFHQIILNEIEPHLGIEKPTFLYDYPSSLAALSKVKESDPRFAERFELYINGIELADCYTELTDWKEQQQRFDRELAEVKRLGKTSYDYDHDFIEALKAGLPPCAGIALGIDRLIMLLAGAKNIADTMYFPLSELFL